MAKAKTHKWTFTSRFRTRAYGWKASKLACQRIREAVSEINKVTRRDPLQGAEGAIKLMEKFWPALQNVDSSSGALGKAVYNAMGVLVDVVIDAPTDEDIRAKWLDRLWEAFMNDGVEFLDPLGERWGEVCGSSDVASQWADSLIPTMRHTWKETKQGVFAYFSGTKACLSSLLAAGRYEELLYLIDDAPRIRWSNRKYGVKALLAMGQKGKAIKYAKNSCGFNDDPIEIDRACEEILLSSGLYDKAYTKYGLKVNEGHTNLATFRNIVRKYPMKDQNQILEDLIKSFPGAEGMWFATAKSLGKLSLALKLAYQSPCEPKTLNRAAQNYLEKEPRFALGIAMASLHWLCEGWGYQITGADVLSAYNSAMKAADVLGDTDTVKDDIMKMVANDRSVGMFVKEIIGKFL
jgi:hypothetical protein